MKGVDENSQSSGLTRLTCVCKGEAVKGVNRSLALVHSYSHLPGNLRCSEPDRCLC